MERHCSNAQAIAEFLQSHPQVEKVYYPRTDEPSAACAGATADEGRIGGIVTAVLRGGLEETRAMLERCELFSLAESLGGVESLIEHPGLMTHASLPAAMRVSLGISDGLIRLSVGIEDVNDLIADLRQALK